MSDTDTEADVERPTVAEIATALDAVRDEYGDTYPEWGRFYVDATRFAKEEMGLDINFQDPNIHFPIVRYQKIPARKIDYRDEFTDEHLAALVAFAQSEL